MSDISTAEVKDCASEVEPNETYQFAFTKEEIEEVYRIQRDSVYKKPCIFLIVLVLFIILTLFYPAHTAITMFYVGAFLVCLTAVIKGFLMYKKAWAQSIERIPENVYEYRLFDEYIDIKIFHRGEMTRNSKCYYKDIEQLKQYGSWIFLQYGGQLFLMRQNELKENSGLYAYMYKLSANTKETITPRKWSMASLVLFIASIASLFFGVGVVSVITGENGYFPGNMWILYLFTPIPVSSIILGLMLKAKGYKYKKNIIAGVIVTIMLCIYGAFAFVF